jgi:hypothetical protein
VHPGKDSFQATVLVAVTRKSKRMTEVGRMTDLAIVLLSKSEISLRINGPMARTINSD